MIEIRKTLNILINNIKDEPIYVLLSGGVDSQSVLFSALELKKKVIVVSFTIDNHLSRDFLSAKKIADTLNLDFIKVVIPSNIESLTRDILTLGNEYKCKKKTEFECTLPMLYIYKTINSHSNGKGIMLSGIGADCYYVLSKKGMIHYKSNPDAYRELLFNNPNYSQRLQHKMLEKKYNIKHYMPYFDKSVFKLFRGASLAECNKPKQKNPVKTQYEKELIKGTYFNHTIYQKGDSGISNMFTKLLDTEWNIKQWKSIVGIYNAVSKKEIVHIIKNKKPYN